MLPIDLIFVRHGQSEGNLAARMSEKGDNSFFTPEFRDRHSRSFRLTDKGIEQAKAAGEWLRKNVPMPLDHFYVSDHIRAKETAVYLDLPQAQWNDKYVLRERDQALVGNYLNHKQDHFDQFFSYPAGWGESIATLCFRLKSGFFDELEKECQSETETAIAVCHGHVMRAAEVIAEDLGHDDFVRLDSSKEPTDRILNCQIIWYTRRDPDTLVECSKFVAVRSVCAHGLKGDYGWRRIQRHRYSNEDLMAEVQKYPRHLNG